VRAKILATLFAAVLIGLCGFGTIMFTREHPLVAAVVAVVVIGLPTAVAVGSWTSRRRSQRNYATAGDAAAATRVAAGAGRSVAELAAWLGVSADALRRASPTYREAHIPKRSGRGSRRLLIPDDATKALQRTVLRRVLAHLHAHPAATGFERGKSVVDNARPHVNRAVVIRMDVIDFFPSTKADRVLRFFQWIGWDREAAEVLTKLTTWDGALPQGAPTSPRLSNLVNRYLDVQIANGIARRGGVYTRYADDITVSLDSDRGRRVRDAIQHLRRILRKHGYRLHTRRKLHVARRHQRQIVTGLVVNGPSAPPPPKQKRHRTRTPPPVVAEPADPPPHPAPPPPAVLPRLPREVRRRLRATAHRIEKGLPPLQGVEQAAGWLAYARMVRSQASRPAPPDA
jgi:hypothetical protein